MAETVGRLDENLNDEDLELLKELATVKAIQREVERLAPKGSDNYG